MVDGPESPRREQDVSCNCPNCQADGQPFEVQEGQGYRRLTYRFVKCQHTWSQTTPLTTEILR